MAEVSLMPKKTATPRSEMAGGVDIFLRIAVVFFLIAVLATGGLFLFGMLTERTLAKQQSALTNLESQFPLETIEQHEEVGNAITISKKLLDGHLHQSGIFKILEDNTLPAVSFSNFSYAEADHKLVLSGEAPSYQAVADQASVYESLDTIESATLGNLVLTGRGTVTFGLTIIFNVSPQNP